MADMNDVKNRLKNMLAVNEEKAAVAAEKSDHVVCVFRLDSFDDVEAVGEALKKNFLVLLDITACDEECARRIRDFMKGGCLSDAGMDSGDEREHSGISARWLSDSGIPELVDFAFQSAAFHVQYPCEVYSIWNDYRK